MYNKDFAHSIGIPIIDTNRNYWLVRTNKGIYFSDFYLYDYIAIGWDEVTDVSLMNETKREQLTELIKKIYKSEKDEDGENVKNNAKYGLIATQLIRFNSEMKKGDIVIIPSENSKHIAFGEITEDYIYTEKLNIDELEATECPYIKRRKVKWLKRQEKDEIDIYLYKILNSHHAITGANDYCNIIDRTLSSFYIKDEIAHFTLQVNQTENIRVKELAELINNNIHIINTFNEIYNENLNVDDIDIKINVHSPGPVEIHGYVGAVAVIGFIIIAVCGGNFKFTRKNGRNETETQAELSSDGFMEKLIKFIDHFSSNKRETIQLKERLIASRENLKIAVPETKQITSLEQSHCQPEIIITETDDENNE